jgi:hypothetical protein
MAGDHPLAERLRLDQRRTERAVLIDGGPALGVLTLDRVRVAAGSIDLGRLFIVELELNPASDRAEAQLGAMAAVLAATPGLAAEPRTKLEHALSRLDQRS